MKQEVVVLPKLRVPGQANWLARGLWLLGGGIIVWFAVVGFALWRRSATPSGLSDAVPVPAAPASAPAFLPPAGASPPAGGSAPAGTPATPAPATTTLAAKPSGALPAEKLRPGKRLRGTGRYHHGSRRWAKARGYGAGKAGGRRAYIARKAYLRKKRLLAARGAGRAGKYPVKTALSLPANDGVGPPDSARPRSAKAGKGDAIDDILRNFK